MKRALIGAGMALVALIGAGGYYQTGSGLFYCGNNEGGRELTFWFAVAVVQLAIYLAASSDALRRLYAATQLLLFPILVIVVAQLITADHSLVSATFLMLPILALLPFGAGWLPTRIGKFELGAIPRLMPLRTLVLWFVFGAWLLLGLWSGLALFVFYSRNLRFAGWPLWLTLALAAGTCAALVFSLVKDKQLPKPRGPLPVGLLLMVLLGAKNPDLAYDSMFYKATRPLLLADGRSALFGIFDHAMLGSTQQEIINALLRILDAAYNPSLISTLAFVSMWLALPTLMRITVTQLSPAQGQFWWKFAAAAVFCLSESQIATATSYQEPLLTLFLAASLLPGALGWSFLGMAVGVKLTAVVVVPLFLVWKLRTGEMLERSRRFTAIAGVLLALVIAGGQVYRNYVYVGRLLPPTEMLASVTDSHGELLTTASGTGEPPRGGIVKNFAFSALNMWGMDRLTSTAYRGDQNSGFHVMPASRWPLLGFLAAIVGIAVGVWQRRAWPVVFAGAFLLGYLVFMAGTTQGRYFIVLSFAAVLLVVVLRELGPPGELFPLPAERRNTVNWLAAGAAALLVGNDLNVGVRINDGWTCVRRLGAPVVRQSWDTPRNDLETELAKLSKLLARNSGTPTLVWADEAIGPLPYLGSEFIFAQSSTDMVLRYFAAKPERARDLASAVGVIVSQDGSLLTALRQRADLSDFAEYAQVDGKTILVSKRLMAGERLIPALSHSLGLFDAFTPAEVDLLPQWHHHRLDDEAPLDTPTGTGVYSTDSAPGGGGSNTGVLVSPSQVPLVIPGGSHSVRLHMSVAMLFPNSDGMELQLFVPDLAEPVGREALTPPASQDALEWKSVDFVLDAGRGPAARRLLLRAASPNGNGVADWVLVREARLSEHASP